MFKYFYTVLLPILFMLGSCSNQLKTEKVKQIASASFSYFLLEPQYSTMKMRGDFTNNPTVKHFVEMMVSKHGFNRQQLYEILSHAKRLDHVLRLMERQSHSVQMPAELNSIWLHYRNQFITSDNVQSGIAFWDQYKGELNLAQQLYGVPPEIIVGIIGVETSWGRTMGNIRILDALATLSFNYPRRAGYFLSELESFFLMLRDDQYNPFSLKGSFAGAMGYGQFMPSSYKKYAVDFNYDGHINLWDPIDAIGSIANYLKAHGWVKDEPAAIQATGQARDLENGLKNKYSISQLAAAGLTPLQSLSKYQQANLLCFNIGTSYQYWYGLPNFYTITRYNHNIHYAMAVLQLGQAIKLARIPWYCRLASKLRFHIFPGECIISRNIFSHS